MEILDFTPVPKRFRFMSGQTWKFTFKINDVTGAVNLNNSDITAIITSPQGAKTYLTKGDGITVSNDGKIFTLLKDWMSVTKDQNDNVSMTPSLQILPKGTLMLQIFITDENGVDTTPIFLYVDVIDLPSDSSDFRMNANTTIEVTLNDGVLIGVGVQPISDRIEWRRVGFRIDVRYIGESTWTTWADFSAINKGDTGMSAYELAVSQGFVGSIAEWLVTLKAPAGRQIASYNALTNTPAITATPANGLNDGDYYLLSTGGPLAFAGKNFVSGATCYEGDQLRKDGNQWLLVKYGYGQMMTKVTEAATSATNAANSATQAATSATNAATSATQAGTSATQAATSASTAAAVAQGASTARPLTSNYNMNFAMSKCLPSYVQFTRSSSATYVDARGVIRTAKNNQSRFTHDSSTLESLGLLIEEERQNFVANSTSFPYNTDWFSQISYDTAPDLSLAIVLEKKGTTARYFQPFDPTPANLVDGFYTRSLFVKPKNTDECIIGFEGVGQESSLGGTVLFNCLTKQFSGDLGVVLEYGYEEYKNGWIRPWISIEKSATKKINGVIYLGYGESNFLNRCAIWGIQFEQGKQVSSYIPTSGVSQVRKNDIAVLKPKIHKEFTIVASGIKSKGWEKSQSGFGTIVGTNNNYMLLGYGSLMNNVNIYDSSGVCNSALLANNALKNTFFNAAMGYSATITLQKVVLNGGAVGFMNTGATTFLDNDWYIGCRNGLGNYLNGTIKSLNIYGKILSDLEMQEVTNIRLAGTAPKSLPTNNDLGSAAFLDLQTILTSQGKVEQTIDGTGASYTRNIRRPYDFYFVVVDSSGGTITSQPPSTLCSANTDYPLVINFPVGKAITYAIIPSFD